MPKLNTPIVKSIITDIKEVVNVSNEIYSWIGEIELQSWKFPTKSGRSINVLEIIQLHKGSAGEMYILLLELAYDRYANLYLMIFSNLIFNFVPEINFKTMIWILKFNTYTVKNPVENYHVEQGT